MKLSPISNSYSTNNCKTQNNTSFKRVVMTEDDYDKIKQAPLKDSEKEIVLRAFDKSKKFLEKLDSDVKLTYREAEKKSFWSAWLPLPESLAVKLMTKNTSNDMIPDTIELLDDIKNGESSDKIAAKIIEMSEALVESTKKSYSYHSYGEDDDLYTNNTGHWDLTDAYIP